MRFVILEHDHPFLHWDLMFEAGEELRTWRLLAEPLAGQAIPAQPLGDHRKIYLDYEGPLSGGRGRVRRWEAGTFHWQSESATKFVAQLAGQRLSGQASLEQQADGSWLFRLV